MKTLEKCAYKGFTLFETVVVILITSIVLFSGVRFFELAYMLYHTQKNVLDADWQGRLAAHALKMDIQLIRSASDISTATATDLAFTDEFGTPITYTLVGTQLQKNTLVLARDVQSIAFSYYNSSGALLSTPVTVSSIRYIVFQINIRKPSSAAFTFSSGAALWNIM